MTSRRKKTNYVNNNLKRPSWRFQILILCITAVAVGITAFLGITTYQAHKQTALSQFNQQQLTLARASAAGIETYFNEVLASLISASRVTAIKNMSPSCLEYMQNMYIGFIPRTSIRRIDEEGKLRYIYPSDGWRNALIGEDYSGKNYFRKARDTHSMILSGIVKNERDELRIRMVAPIFSTTDGTKHFGGILVVSFDLESISEVFISHIVSGETGYSWMLNQDGFFLAHNVQEFVGQNAFTIREKKNPELSYESINKIQEQVLAGREGIGQYKSGWHRGKVGYIDKLIAYSPIHVVDQVWSVAVVAPVEEVDRIIQRTSIQAINTFAFIILILIVAGIFSSLSVFRWSNVLKREVRRRTKELRETSTYLNNLIKGTTAPIVVLDPEQRITIFNRAAERMSGRSEAEIRGHMMDVLFPDDHRGELLQKLAAVQQGEHNLSGEEIPIVAKDGGIRIGAWNSSNIIEEDGSTLIATIIHGEDITDRKLSEDRIKESEERYKNLFEGNPDAIFLGDRHTGILLDVNTAATQLLMKSRDEIIGLHQSLLHPPGLRDDESGKFMERAAQQNSFMTESTVQRSDGAEIPVEILSRIVTIQGREVIQGIFRDISERKRSIERLRENEERFRKIFESGAIGMGVLGLDYKFERVNAALCTMLGYEESELVGKTYLDITHPDHIETDRQNVARLLHGDLPYYKTEKRYVRKNGDTIWSSVTASVVDDENKNPLYFIGMVEDITERRIVEEEKKNLEAQLLHAQKMEALGTLVAGVAHEINNPVNKIIFDMPLLQKIWNDIMPLIAAESEKDPDRKYGGLSYDFLKDNLPLLLSDMEMAANRVVKTVNNLKSFTRQSSITDMRPMEINTAVHNAVRLIETTLRKAMITLELDLAEDSPIIEGNLQNIEQIIMNLAINAVQAITHGRGRVTITTAAHKKNRQVVLSIRDNGRGIEPSVGEKIFDPFVTTRQSEGGTGLGLPITYNLVEAHGGSITFTSEPGEGTTFIIVFPSLGSNGSGGRK